MSHKEPLKLLLIINPIAGKMAARQYDIPAMFVDYQVTPYYTKDAASTISYVAENASLYDILVCVGGDGTLNNVISGIMQCQKRPMLGYIPAGTTNDFASSLGIPKEIPIAAKSIQVGSPMPLDVGNFNGRHFVYIASFGAFTESSYKASQAAKNRFGHLAYVMEAMRDLPNIRPVTLEVKTPLATFSGNYIFGAVTNTTSIGGMVKIHHTDIAYNDGLFEVLLVRMPQNVLQLQKIVAALLKQQFSNEYITFFHTDKITFSMDTEIPWSLDGEYESGAKTVQILNHHSAVQFLTANHNF